MSSRDVGLSGRALTEALEALDALGERLSRRTRRPGATRVRTDDEPLELVTHYGPGEPAWVEVFDMQVDPGSWLVVGLAQFEVEEPIDTFIRRCALRVDGQTVVKEAFRSTVSQPLRRIDLQAHAVVERTEIGRVILEVFEQSLEAVEPEFPGGSSLTFRSLMAYPL